jgi:hypothetical protein
MFSGERDDKLEATQFRKGHPMSTPEFMTTTQVGERTRVSPVTLRRWRIDGSNSGPKSFKIGGRVLYKTVDVDAWLEEAYVKANKAS